MSTENPTPSGPKTYTTHPVEAMKLTETNGYQVARWCGGDLHVSITPGTGESKAMHVDLAVLPANGAAPRVRIGQYLTRSHKGEWLVLDADYFEDTYPVPAIAIPLGGTPTLAHLKVDPRLAALDEADAVWQWDPKNEVITMNGYPLTAVTEELPREHGPYRWAEHEAGDPQ